MTTARKTTILWFRRDLRLKDNAAINWAIDNSDAILPIYIHTNDTDWSPGSASRWWLHHSLQELEERLKSLGHKLNYFEGNSLKVLDKLIDETNADALIYNKVFEPSVFQQDELLNSRLEKKINIHSCDDGLFTIPGKILNNQQLPYRVFTPFYKKIRPLLNENVNTQLHHLENFSTNSLETVKPVSLKKQTKLESLKLIEGNNWHNKLSKYWNPGESSTNKMIQVFFDEALDDYSSNRDIPSVSGTSMLSAHLHFGEITPQRIFLELQPLIHETNNKTAINSAETFIKQLVWREFAQHILWHYPHTANHSMSEKYKDSFWQFDEKEFNQWKHGETGVPIVDAGMKQLWETGWMHNRVRMIVSSFLTKNLGIHWIYGAQWFWDTLVDADLANNSMGWQWVAGCGVDAAPYYRIFNPQRQAERFDKRFNYVNHWVPNHIELDYPKPMVDLSASREAALSRYKLNIS